MVEVLKSEEVLGTSKFYKAMKKPKEIPPRRTQNADKDKDLTFLKKQLYNNEITLDVYIKYTMQLYEIHRKKA